MSSERIERQDIRPASLIVCLSLFSIYFTIAPIADGPTQAMEKRNIKNICYTPSRVNSVDEAWIEEGLVEVVEIINNLAPISEKLYTLVLASEPEAECDLDYRVLGTVEEVKNNCGDQSLYGGCYNPTRHTVFVGGDIADFPQEFAQCDSIPEIVAHELGHASGVYDHNPSSPLMRDGCNEIVENEVRQIFWE